MIEGFDKEIDALLRQTAQGETAFTADNPKSPISNPELHLDADEISAFADVNALPEKTRLRLTAHFADCDRCRKILSNVISLNSETASETAHVQQTAKIQTAAPWYRRLFAVPNLAYALGTLVLIFGGLIAFTFFKNSPQTVEVSQIREKPINMGGASSDGETRVTESNAAMSNSELLISNSSTATNSASVHSSNASAANAPPNSVSPGSTAVAVNKQSAAKTETTKNELPVENESASAKKDKNELLTNSANFAEQKKQTSSEDKMRSQNENKVVQSDAPAPKSTSPSIADTTRSATAELPVNGRTMNKLKNAPAKKSQSVTGETRTVRGKTFRRENGIWYDAGYNGQGTTNVRRDSEDFKKLDTGLRSIADNFGGTVIVVWKGKAYRIQ